MSYEEPKADIMQTEIIGEKPKEAELPHETIEDGKESLPQELSVWARLQMMGNDPVVRRAWEIPSRMMINTGRLIEIVPGARTLTKIFPGYKKIIEAGDKFNVQFPNLSDEERPDIAKVNGEYIGATLKQMGHEPENAENAVARVKEIWRGELDNHIHNRLEGKQRTREALATFGVDLPKTRFELEQETQERLAA